MAQGHELFFSFFFFSFARNFFPFGFRPCKFLVRPPFESLGVDLESYSASLFISNMCYHLPWDCQVFCWI